MYGYASITAALEHLRSGVKKGANIERVSTFREIANRVLLRNELSGSALTVSRDLINHQNVSHTCIRRKKVCLVLIEWMKMQPHEKCTRLK